MENDLGTFNHDGQTILYSEIKGRLEEEVFPMSMVGEDAEAIQAAVNQGIDYRLEACYLPHRGDNYTWEQRTHGRVISRRLECKVSRESLPVLIRRLSESDDKRANNLADSILSQLEVIE
jgi:hypothetical protein